MIALHRRLVLPLPLIVLACMPLAACGGPSAEHGGQSSLIDRTFAGRNKCDAKNHNRPFIIEWDATDQSSFQARASSDVVFVKYEGCDLQVLEGCSDDSVKGKFGGYRAVDWTAGQLEAIDIADEDQLFAKLPLGALSLDGRVQHGEKFHMEYFVSGTRSATREHVYRNALSKIAACQGATHFVYGYNLGAFGLASASNLKGEVNGSYLGFGGGGSHSTDTKADKKGGDLSSCTSDAAREVETCKVPIRLTLREISDGDDPDVAAAQAPETDQAANLAGQLKAETDAQKEAAQHAKAALDKLNAHDGKGCIAELDQHDRLDPRPEGLSTSPKTGQLARRRGVCVMLAGQCDAGKQLFRKGYDAEFPNDAPEHAQSVLDATTGQFCQGASMSSRDKILHAKDALMQGGMTGRPLDSASCMDAYQTLKTSGALTGDTHSDDPAKVTAVGITVAATKCFSRAGDCATAYKVYAELTRMWRPDQKDQYMRPAFEGTSPECKGK
ncbi:MAG TPA: hypothetical protein VIF15_06705 [Polyangiaceae bacterium]|jgi:hypothetical protein